MTDGEIPLPEDGPAQIAHLPLPEGQRVYGEDGERPVAWVTSLPMADAGLAWLAASDAHLQTGLVPMLLTRAGSRDGLTGDAFGLWGLHDVALIDAKSARDVLAKRWGVGEDPIDEGLTSDRAPFGAEFPALAAVEQTRLPMAALHGAAIAEEPAFLALVAANRPADVPAAVGWSISGGEGPGTPDAFCLEISAVLRSWESRFGARLLRIGSDAIMRVLVERPPSTLEAATRLAAEHLAFADECDGGSVHSVCDLAEILVGKPVWQFRWD